MTFHVDAYPNDVFRGKVQQVRLNPVIESNVVTYAAIVSAPNAELKLKPGMTATLTVEVTRRENVLRVPSAALRFKPSRTVLAALGQPAADSGGQATGGSAGCHRGQRADAGQSRVGLDLRVRSHRTGSGHDRRDRRGVHRDCRRRRPRRHDACDASDDARRHDDRSAAGAHEQSVDGADAEAVLRVAVSARDFSRSSSSRPAEHGPLRVVLLPPAAGFFVPIPVRFVPLRGTLGPFPCPRISKTLVSGNCGGHAFGTGLTAV